MLFRLTPEGERLVVWSKRILAEHDAFKAEVGRHAVGQHRDARAGHHVPPASARR
ncbi:hypothetical protein ACWC0C_03180 [Streptomyces sp. NPDC001709]